MSSDFPLDSRDKAAVTSVRKQNLLKIEVTVFVVVVVLLFVKYGCLCRTSKDNLKLTYVLLSGLLHVIFSKLFNIRRI